MIDLEMIKANHSCRKESRFIYTLTESDAEALIGECERLTDALAKAEEALNYIAEDMTDRSGVSINGSEYASLARQNSALVYFSAKES